MDSIYSSLCGGARDFNIVPWTAFIPYTLWWRARLQYHGVPWASIYSSLCGGADFNIMVFLWANIYSLLGVGARDFNIVPWTSIYSLYSDGAHDFNIMVFHGPALIPHSVVAPTSMSWCSMGQHLFLTRRWRA